MTTITIDRQAMENARNQASVTYRPMFGALDGLVHQLVKDKDKKETVKSTVNHTVNHYTTAYEACKTAIDQEPEMTTLSEADKRTYSAYLAASVVTKVLGNGENGNRSKYLSDYQLGQKNLLVTTGSSYSQVKTTLENLVEHLSVSKQGPELSAKTYFAELSRQAKTQLHKTATGEQLKHITWTIGAYSIDGLRNAPKPTDTDRSTQTSQQENEEFDTPLVRLHIPEDKRLPKERIVGDQAAIIYLERMVDCLMLYDPQTKKNPAVAKKLFNPRLLIKGLPGGGKGMVMNYTVDYAESQAMQLGQDLLVTSFNVQSSYVDGSIQKFKSQIQQIINENRLFLLYQDEIDDLLLDESQHRRDADKHQVRKEFNKFTDGAYPNNGNYLLLSSINDINNLSKDNMSRFYHIHWEGAVSAEDKAKLLAYKLEEGIEKGYVQLNKEAFKQFGKAAYDYKLTGRDINTIASKLLADSFDWQRINELHELKGDYAKQLAAVDAMYRPITANQVYQAVEQMRKEREMGQRDSELLHIA